jgi:hypothetical protein
MIKERWFLITQDFWRGLYITINRIELWLHHLSIRVFQKINYEDVVIMRNQIGAQRHPFRNKRR